MGAALAKLMGLEVVDTDALIEARENQSLQQILDQKGKAVFLEIEETVLMSMPLYSSVISTGGSVVYSENVMRRLSKESTVIYLEAALKTIETRVALAPRRGIAAPPEQALLDVYDERLPLYERYGQFVVNCDHDSPENIARQIEMHCSNG